MHLNYSNANGACINNSPASITCNNRSHVTYKCTLINLATNVQYTSSPGPSNITTISNVVPGSYNVILSRSGDTAPYSFKVVDYQDKAYYTAGATATFYNIILGSNSYVLIDDVY